MLMMDVDNTPPRPSAAPDDVLIAIDQLSKTYVSASGAAVHALSRISLDIKPGEFVCVVGPSGCGKSTLLRLLAGLDGYSDGRLLLDGEAVAGPSRKVGVVFQAANLLPWMTVRDNVRLPLRVGGKHAPAADRIERLLAVTGLGEFGDKYPYELSGGMQQRAGICRALARDPEILLMDEPFGALDALTRERLNLELQRIWQENRKTILLITHSISEAIFLADRVIVMSARPGRILADLHVPIPRPRTFDDIVLHPDYARLAKEVRGLLNAQEHGHD
ncbi:MULTISPECIES: ABC transporter ATP-binding protein [Bradyrhizobium]|jgi:NitT/TauT family transport system ATP-binding protein|uniref:ABC transporter ATP-binding protein n=2 Tax=Bradyrhizobium TaxID=374 RepID=A0ABS5GFT5_9BRAD|nr:MULTISPECIES: ABC transporter ATP-binding protein [Bradyrhizobium]MBR1140195.1 ABC transporter ATP-binding protein [Bradyrhizobium denitrificans]MDU0954518.1 ABC transporter ATP-binding protein [Bradyrhizobium sp.]MDU1496180.1 ABC transporter ATP-binding protein [Bradyrhizobium sp.]MDU1546331.1 ABC transporter ATP-binding protein [Bradyrhizobium sp.]MDU1804172.1 ABC transporter ATP-binding protein [Bradyrhizobium sp.]